MPLSFALKPVTGASDEEALLIGRLEGSAEDKSGADELTAGSGFGAFKNINMVVVIPNKIMMDIKIVFFSVFTPKYLSRQAASYKNR